MVIREYSPIDYRFLHLPDSVIPPSVYLGYP